MSERNICKFVSGYADLGLEISCFIFESDDETMRKVTRLSHHTMLLVLKGEGEFSFDRYSVEYTIGSVVFGFKNEDFTVQSRKNTEYMYIGFGGVRAEEIFKRFGIGKTNRVFTKNDGLIPLWKESLSRAGNETVDLAAESMLLYTFSRFSGVSDKKNAVINTVTNITEKRFNDPNLSISVIAGEIGYNPKYLSHFFKQKTGVTYSEYLKNQRIKYAVSLLEHGIDSVKNVALLSGFDNPFYFSTVFKGCIGLSPKEYAEQYFNK